MSKNFKSNNILIALLVGSSINTIAAPVMSLNVEGSNITLTYVQGTYNALESQLLAQPWYLDDTTMLAIYNGNLSQLTLTTPQSIPTSGGFRNSTLPITLNYSLFGNNRVYYIAGPESGFKPLGDYDLNTQYYWLISVLGPTAEDTLNSFRPQAFNLRNALNLQSSMIVQGLSYDCTLFDAKNICASFTGSKSTQNGSDLDATTGTLVVAHRPNANIRFGGYINQNFGTSTQGGLRLDRGSPSIGAFVNYTLASGLNVRGSIGSGKMDMQTTREAIDTAEAGVGNSNIKTQGVQLELNKAFDIKPGWAAIPYGGLRKVTAKRAGYTEIASDTVTAPLTYADLKQSQTTAFGGVRFLGNIAPKTQLLLSAGVEHDMSSSIDDYAATGVDALGSISMQGDVKKNRSVLSAALSYDIAKNERASVSVLQRQAAFDSKAVTSVGFTYTKGF